MDEKIKRASSAQKLDIRIYPDPILRQKAQSVRQVTQAVIELIDSMAATMYANEGAGLAATQVGVLQRVIVIDIGEGLVSLIDPEIVEARGEETCEEGCLSLPELMLDVTRAESVVVRHRDRNGHEADLQAEGLLARAIQHEVDHLDGVLIIDRMRGRERLKAEMAYARGTCRGMPTKPL
jgi:peptide deformylase